MYLISNGNRTEGSQIRSVIIPVITKSNERAAEVLFVYHEHDNKLFDKKQSTQREVKNTPKSFFRLVTNFFASLRPKFLSVTNNKRIIVEYLM